MNFDDLKDQLTEQFGQVWAKIQDSSTFIALKERYENLTPPMQKTVVAASAAVAILTILSFPYGTLTESSTQLTEFEDKRGLIREMLKVSREVSQVPQLNGAMDVGALQGMIESELTRMQLLPEQIISQQATDAAGSLIPKNLISGAFSLQLSKLNLKQIIDVGYYLQAVAPNIKLEDMKLDANASDNKYFDVVFKLVAFTVPKAQEPEPEVAPGKAPKRKGSN